MLTELSYFISASSQSVSNDVLMEEQLGVRRPTETEEERRQRLEKSPKRLSSLSIELHLLTRH